MGETAQHNAVDPWLAFVTATDEQGFVSAWLSLVSEQIPGARSGLVVFTDAAANAVQTIASWPPESREAIVLSTLLEKVVDGNEPVIEALPDRGSFTIGYPLVSHGEVQAVIGFECAAAPAAVQEQALRALHWGSGWLSAYLADRISLDSQAVTERLTIISEFVISALGPAEPKDVAGVITTRLANSCGADTVSFGRLRDGQVALFAQSNRARLEKGANQIRAIEAAMNECADQDRLLHYPSRDPANGAMLKAHEALSARGEGAALLSIPVVHDQSCYGVLLLERQSGEGFDTRDQALAEMAAFLAGPLIETATARSRSLPAHARDRLQELLSPYFGPHQTLIRAGTAALMLAFLYIALWPTDWRVNAPVVLEGAQLQSSAALVSGILREAPKRAGDRVKEGDLLVRLDQRELSLERLRLLSEQRKIAQEQRGSLANVDRTQARILAARLEQVATDLALVDRRLELTELRAPFDGILVSGDWSQKLGSPIDQGVVMFEIAPANDMRAILKVDERDIAQLQAGQEGFMRLQAMPDETILLSVNKVTPIAEVVDGQNVFRVEAQLEVAEEEAATLRPGMAGIGKVHVGEKSLLAIWTRRFTDWFRITIWEYLP